MYKNGEKTHQHLFTISLFQLKVLPYAFDAFGFLLSELSTLRQRFW